MARRTGICRISVKFNSDFKQISESISSRSRKMFQQTGTYEVWIEFYDKRTTKLIVTISVPNLEESEGS